MKQNGTFHGICTCTFLREFIVSESDKAGFIWASAHADALGSSYLLLGFVFVFPIDGGRRIYVVCRAICMRSCLFRFMVSEWHTAEFMCPFGLSNVLGG